MYGRGAYVSVEYDCTVNRRWQPHKSVYPALNGDKDKTPLFLNKPFKKEENKNRETITVLWSRLGSFRLPSWTPNHFVPVVRRCDEQPTASETAFPYQRSCRRGSVQVHPSPTQNNDIPLPLWNQKILPHQNLRLYYHRL